MIKWIEIDTSKVNDYRKGGVPQPPTVTIKGNHFSLSNLAVNELCDIYGGSNFCLTLKVSECGHYLSIGVKANVRERTGLPKTISSNKAVELLKLQDTFGPTKVVLNREGSYLIGRI